MTRDFDVFLKELFSDIKALNFVFSHRVRRIKMVAEKGTETENGVNAVNNGIKHRHARSEYRLMHLKEKNKLSDAEKSHQVLARNIHLQWQVSVLSVCAQYFLCVPKSFLVLKCMDGSNSRYSLSQQIFAYM